MVCQSSRDRDGCDGQDEQDWERGQLRRVDDVQSPTGGLKVQLQDETGRAFSGSSMEDREPIVEDALDAPHALERFGRCAPVERQNGRASV